MNVTAVDAPALVADTVQLRFDRDVGVRELSLTLHHGEIVALVGHNGAGKTTTLRLLAGELVPDGGRVSVFGLPIATPGARRRIGFLREHPHFDDDVTLREHLQLACALYAVADAPQCIEHALSRVALSDVADVAAGVLSKGQRTRAGLALAMVHTPSVLLLDEPQSGLDPMQIQTLHRTLGEGAATRATLISTHHVMDVIDWCTRVLVMVDGRIVLDAPTQSHARGGVHLEAILSAMQKSAGAT